MKKLITILLILAPYILHAQVVITMEQEGGVYKVPCTVNGLRMKFIFDTGASTVCISESMAYYMLDNGYLSKSDIVGSGKSYVADGREVNNIEIILKDIEIAGLHLQNVRAHITEGLGAPLLLGQTAIQRLGQITINQNRLVISKAKSSQTSALFSEEDEYALYLLSNKIDQATEKGDKVALCMALEEYRLEYWKHYPPKDAEYLDLAKNFADADLYEKTKYWLLKITDKEDLDDLDLYYYLWGKYYYTKNDYNRAMFYYTKTQEETINESLWRLAELGIKKCKSYL